LSITLVIAQRHRCRLACPPSAGRSISSPHPCAMRGLRRADLDIRVPLRSCSRADRGTLGRPRSARSSASSTRTDSSRSARPRQDNRHHRPVRGRSWDRGRNRGSLRIGSCHPRAIRREFSGMACRSDGSELWLIVVGVREPNSRTHAEAIIQEFVHRLRALVRAGRRVAPRVVGAVLLGTPTPAMCTPIDALRNLASHQLDVGKPILKLEVDHHSIAGMQTSEPFCSS